MAKVKVLIVSVLAGSCHNNVADLLYEKLKKDPRFSVVRHTNPTLVFESAHKLLTNHILFVHDWFVKYSSNLVSDLILLGTMDCAIDSVKQIRKHKPDIVISTHFAIANSFMLAKKITGQKYKHVSAVLDLGNLIEPTIPYNLDFRSDYFVVYDNKTSIGLTKIHGHDKKGIIYCGHGVKEVFEEMSKQYSSKKEARKEVQKRFNTGIYQNISSDKTTILVAGGDGGSIEKTYKLLRLFTRRQRHDGNLLDNYQFFVICGNNKRYFNKLKALHENHKNWSNIFPFAWLEQKEYAIIQIACDYPILFGVGPSTMHELLQTNCLPLIVHKLRGIHEIGNIEFFSRKGLGFFIEKRRDVADFVYSDIKLKNYQKIANNILNENKKRLENFPDMIFQISQTDRRNVNIGIGRGRKILSKFLTWISICYYHIVDMVMSISVKFNKK